MSDELKKFIEDNRDGFDNEAPPVKIWENIESVFFSKEKKKTIIRPIYKRAMAAAAVLVIATGAYFLVFEKPAAVKPAAPGQEGVVSDEAESLTPEMRQFVKMIDMKQEELKKLAIEQPALYQQFTNDLNQLDSSYAALKKQLNTATNKELLLEAMIQNLQLQLSVLNQQLNIIHQIKEKSKSHEKNTQAI